MKFDGYAIGGVSVGEPESEIMKAVEMTEPLLPADQPRYAMGLGSPPSWSNWSRAASICSTACSQRGWPATDRLHTQGLRQRQGWLQQGRRPADRGRMRMHAAETSPELICATC